ncbi:MAG: tRNA (adenosine(37)-N6)-threonylcarbamoyltransferase complex dimerization subunit type 1 TsaB [Chloroflexi bacterium]|nr:tRNA (adenosine(37)-N6)-threonylcarbamoyltransferase complex dimerization subunit type 1 TsaB [Chloroflexota bacterium]
MTPPGADRGLMLALDTATAQASVAVHDGGHLLAETTWMAGREHSAMLMVEVSRTLERAGQSRANLTGLAVTRGPGSFTGVRVALSVAKGLAAGLGVPLWTATTLEVLAYAAGPVDLPVRAAVDAGRGRVATALFAGGHQVQPTVGMAIENLAALDVDATFLVGDIPQRLRAVLAAMPHLHVLSAALSARRAGLLAELAWAAARRGEPGDPATADAEYLERQGQPVQRSGWGQTT